jgi:hypothetical protein
MKAGKIRNKEKTIKRLFNSKSAASTVIAAVLLLSIIFTIFAVIRIAYIPEWKDDAEQLHMSEVQRDMTKLKSTVDMITFLQYSNSNSTPDRSSITVPSVTIPISMGGGELPILEPTKSSGTLSINSEPCNIIITNNSSKHEFLSDQTCGGITYYSNNRQYVDQILRYENGAVIIKQGDRSLMRYYPSFSLGSDPANKSLYTISIRTINISGNPDTISSDADASLTLTGISYNNSIYAGAFDSINFEIITKYPDAWKSYLSETANKAKLVRPNNFTLENNTSDNGVYEVYFNLSSSNNLYKLYVSNSSTLAELGIGSNSNVNG